MASKEWLLYVLECSDNSLYTGVTTCIERRLRQHNGEISGGAKYTAGRRPVKLLATRKIAEEEKPLKEESKFKKLPRTEKLAEIKKWR